MNQNLAIPQREKPQATMAAWANALKNLSPENSRAVQALGESRADKYLRMTAAQLPTAPYRIVSLTQSNKAIAETLAELNSDNLYLLIEPNGHTSVDRYSAKGISRTRAAEVLSQWRTDYGDGFVALAATFVQVEYQGVIICRKDGSLMGELIKGNGTPITRGDVIPDISFRKDLFTPCIHYSTPDPHLRNAIYQAIEHLPALKGGHTEYLPGYYEVSLISGKEGSALLSPIFTDYSESSTHLR